MDAIADYLRGELAGVGGELGTDLQVEGRMLLEPSPPALDVYPADPFYERMGYGKTPPADFRFILRARVATKEQVGAQEILLALMDPLSGACIETLLGADETLDGEVTQAVIEEGPSGFQQYLDPGGQGAWLGVQWTLRVIP